MIISPSRILLTNNNLIVSKPIGYFSSVPCPYLPFSIGNTSIRKNKLLSSHFMFSLTQKPLMSWSTEHLKKPSLRMWKYKAESWENRCVTYQSVNGKGWVWVLTDIVEKLSKIWKHSKSLCLFVPQSLFSFHFHKKTIWWKRTLVYKCDEGTFMYICADF